MTDPALVRAPVLARLLLVGADLLLVGVALWFGYFLRFHLELGALESYAKAPPREYVKAYVLLAGAILILCHGWGVFRMHSLRSTLDEAAVIAKAVTVATGAFLALTFFYRQFTYSRLTLVYFCMSCIAVLAAAHAVFRRWQLRRYQRGLDRRRALLIGRGPHYLAQRIATEPAFGVEVLGYLEVGNGAAEPVESWHGGGVGTLVRSAQTRRAAEPRTIPKLGTVAELSPVLDRAPIEEVIVVEQELSHVALLEVIDACERREIKVLMVPPIYDLLVGPDDFTYVHNVPLLRVDERRFHRLARTVKRVFDIAVSAVLLVLLWPLLLLLIALIRLESRGAALFVQVRAGQNGRPFGMYKLRTMVAGAETRLREVVDLEALDEPVFKVACDPRVTRVGRLLRRTSLDELPQLWNVLKGDMSLVGPRPEELRIVERYDLWQRRRLKVKPGITGLQQVAARGVLSSLNDRVRLDVYYIRRQSLLLDVAILLRTVWVVAMGRGAV